VLTTARPSAARPETVAAATPEGGGEPAALPRGARRARAAAVVTSVVQRFLPEEILFGVFAVALIALVTLTGHVGIVVHRLIAELKFVALIAGVALVIFIRAYVRTTAAGERRFGLDTARSRVGGAVAWRTVREFSPLFLCLAAYEALHDLTPVLRPHVDDALLVRSDNFLFRGDVDRWLDDHLASITMTHFMTFCYLTYAFAGPIYAGIQYYRGRYRAFHDFALAITITAFIGYAGYLLLPAVGPYMFQPDLYPDPLPGWGHGGLLDLIAKMKGEARDCFPSLHTAMTTVALVSMWRDARKLFWLYLPIGLGLFLSTMYLRVHYATDVLAGFATAAIALLLAPRINRWWSGRRVPREPVVTLPAPRNSPDELVIAG